MAPTRRFPALKARRALQLLNRIGYHEVSQRGSHRKLVAEGRETIVFAWHQGETVPPRALRHMLAKKANLTEGEISKVLKGGRL